MFLSQKYFDALNFAKQKHKGQYRIGGDEYITHPLAVSEYLKEKGFSEKYLIAALFHDLLEDTDTTEEDVLRLSDREVLKAVKILTKQKNYDMSEYVGNIRNNPIAFAVKGADRLHNLHSAIYADIKFRKKYIEESRLWYYDFLPEIPDAIRALEESILDCTKERE